MRFSRFCGAIAAALVAVGITTLPAFATTTVEGTGLPVPYVAAFAPVFGPSAVPHAGTMRLLVQGGTISGSYTGISVRPDRFNNRIEPVVGTLADDGYVQLSIGNALSFTGTMTQDGTIDGTATYGGQLYEFTAEPGSPGRPYR
ncbi:MAG: hypothetical protein WBW76_09750 [Candidatus Cybelea sp.]